MNGENLTKTPYNTIYEALDNNNKGKNGGNTSNSSSADVVICCQHGGQCQYAVAPAKEQYVNLPPKTPKAQELAAKLGELVANEPRGKPREMMSLNSIVEAGVLPRKRTPKKRPGKRKEPQPIDDDQSYVMLGEQSTTTDSSRVESITTVQEAPPTTTDISTFEVVPVKSSAAISAYLGVLTTAGAEAILGHRGQFGLFHQLQSESRLDTLSDSLPLILIYRTTTRAHRHYPIRLTADREFFVDCGLPRVRRHVSLDQLVRYYSAAASVDPNDPAADSFAWWLE